MLFFKRIKELWLSLDEPSLAPAGNHGSGIHQNKYPAQDDEHNYSRGNWEIIGIIEGEGGK